MTESPSYPPGDIMLKKTIAAVVTLVASAFLTNLIVNRVRSEG